MTKTIGIAHIDPLTLGKVNAFFGFVTGLIGGLLTLFTSGVVADYLQTIPLADPTVIPLVQQAGFAGLLLFLLLGVIIGFISGALSAVIYNFVVKMVGPLKVVLEE